MTKLSKIPLLSSAAMFVGSAKPAKAKSVDTSKTKGNSKGGKAKPETKAAEPVKTGGRGKQALFLQDSNILTALTHLKARDMAGFEKAGFSMHHVRQLGSGVSGGPFKVGLGFVEMKKDETERKEGESGRRPMVPVLTSKGEAWLKKAEQAEARRVAKEAAVAEAEKAAAKAAKANKAKPKEEKAPEPVSEAQPAESTEAPQPITVTVPEGTEVNVETAPAAGDQPQEQPNG